MGAGDPRLRDLIVPWNAKHAIKKGSLALVGFPFDLGTVKNGGRHGARTAPGVVRKTLAKTGPLVNAEMGLTLESLQVLDTGDVAPGAGVTGQASEEQLQQAHVALRTRVAHLAKSGALPIMIGGSNDQSFPNAMGLLEQYPNLDVINLDAHMDVRPGKGHSGSPFQELLNSGVFKGQLTEFAIQGNQASNEHTEWAKSRGVHVMFLREVLANGAMQSFQRVLQSSSMPLFVSFDIDSVRASDCPGVSCPGVRGLSAQDALDICFEAGSNHRVVGLDISEFNPLVEEDRSARLASAMIYYFMLGYSSRLSSAL